MDLFRILIFVVCLITGTIGFGRGQRGHPRDALFPPGYWRTQPLEARLEELRKRDAPFCFKRYRGMMASLVQWPCGCSSTGFGCKHDRTDYTRLY